MYTYAPLCKCGFGNCACVILFWMLLLHCLKKNTSLDFQCNIWRLLSWRTDDEQQYWIFPHIFIIIIGLLSILPFLGKKMFHVSKTWHVFWRGTGWSKKRLLLQRSSTKIGGNKMTQRPPYGNVFVVDLITEYLKKTCTSECWLQRSPGHVQFAS